MQSAKANCWEHKRCGREPGGERAQEAGVCPAATATDCDGVNRGRNAGRLCWAVAGTLCEGRGPGAAADPRRCGDCTFLRRVKYEEGCHFQLLRPGRGVSEPAELHSLVNHLVALIGICRDIFALLAEQPLLKRVTEHALRITDSLSASVYLFSESREELLLAAHAGSLDRPERLALDDSAAAAQAVRATGLRKDFAAFPGLECPATVAAVPIGGHEGAAGLLELVKRGSFSADDEWFLREFALIAGLGIGNARLVEERSQLRRFDKAKSRFVSLLMHQIVSPLATAACSLQAIRQLGEKLSASDREELTHCAIERIESIQALSKKLLDLAAIRGGKSLRDIRPVCPAVPLRQEVEDRLPLARDKGVDLLVDDRSQGAQVAADPDGLRIVFGNLLDNAIKYSTGPVKRVEVELAREEGGVCVRVKDSGIGIPAEEQPRVFEELFRGSNAAGAGAAGFGLGLAVVRELVDRYNGRIELESAVGVGTTFTLRFPALAAAECSGA